MFRPAPKYEVLDLFRVRVIADNSVKPIDDEILAKLPPFVQRCLAFKWNQSPQTALLANLYPFQKQGVRKANVFGGSILFADEMGSGKTFQALATVHYHGGRVLIVCPSYLKSNWKHEALLRANIDTVILKSSKDVERQPPGDGNWILAYDIAAKQTNILCSAGFSSVIFDECHMLKNHRSKRWRALRKLSLKIPHRVLCSGTPAPNGRNCELYCQLKMVRPELLGTWTDFVWRYTVPRKNPFGGFDFNNNRLSEELAFFLSRCFQIRRLKRDVLADLPPKIRQKVLLDSSVPYQLTAAYRRWESLDDDNFEKKSLLSQLYLMTAEAKIPPVVKYFKESELPKRFLVFAYHKSMMHAIYSSIEASNVAIITGETPMEERHIIVNEFQEMKLDRLVLSLGACGTGLTLTKACTHVFFSELHWSPSDLLQAEDRTHRIGVEGTVNVSYLIVKGTLDDLMWRILEKKVRNIDKLDQRNDRKW